MEVIVSQMHCFWGRKGSKCWKERGSPLGTGWWWEKELRRGNLGFWKTKGKIQRTLSSSLPIQTKVNQQTWVTQSCTSPIKVPGQLLRDELLALGILCLITVFLYVWHHGLCCLSLIRIYANRYDLCKCFCLKEAGKKKGLGSRGR